MKEDNPIFVTGIERSGSSIIARILTSCGAFSGAVTDMQENKRIKKLVDQYYINWLGAPINGQSALPDTLRTYIRSDWKGKVDKFMNEEGWNGSYPWMYKSSRLCHIWPQWRYAYPDAKWIIVRRRTSDIVQSCLKTGFMNAYSDADGWLDWVHQHEERFVQMIDGGLQYMEVWPERMAYGDFRQIYEMLQWLELPWNNDIIELVKPLLKNSKQSKEKGV